MSINNYKIVYFCTNLFIYMLLYITFVLLSTCKYMTSGDINQNKYIMQEILTKEENLTSEQLSLLEVAYKWVDKNYNDFFHYWGSGKDVDWIENDMTVFVDVTSTKWQSGTITITLMNNYDDAVICQQSFDYDTEETDFPQSFEEFKNQINK